MIHSRQRNHACLDRDNRTIAECRAKTNCKKCRFALCLLAGMRPWYLREARDIAFPFPYMIPLAQSTDNCKERQIATLLHADIAHEHSRLSKYEPNTEQSLTIASVLSTSTTYHNHVNHANHIQAIPVQMDCSPRRRKDSLGADLACSVDYIKAFEFFSALARESKSAIILRSALVLTNFTSSFTSFIKSTHPEAHNPSNHDSRVTQALHQIALSIQEASIVKALIVCNSAIEGIAASDLRILKDESEAYGKMLFRVLLEKRGSRAPIVFVEVMGLFEILFEQAQKQKNQRLLMSMLGQEGRDCPILDEVMLS